MTDKKQLALDTLNDAVSDFLYYDRKEDEELSCEDMKTLIVSGRLTVDEMVAKFRQSLESKIKENFQS